MEVKLHLKERIYLGNILPGENSLVDYQLKKAIIEKVTITEEEKKEFDFVVREDGTGADWNGQKDFENGKIFNFTDAEAEYIMKGVQAASEGTHPDDYWLTISLLYDKFKRNA
jgi:hypothetical protein